ncbi:hypothetical protein A3J90_00410 [candidate division WOR-1 bacterium RIFOXYC2_FULL_37_10]|uniref:Uncharacterized protein n=1 Tax=candidate division WOR-1 bacterium RIFOXYB2_FULL_37_13 TaxID=1802579 RepID=A0A1F4SMR7_UNCSA|nr:MAG: hypothetical protein A2310_00295 [candidate division WOR-1 bacterium RIFOXYB2_FULL_37_13]OGC32593.1 MAG: hypothetical protein A3J90_00410 [candidate division WOR-1 bacterium RIFOXYC2_FULL_37_10]
MTQSGAIIIHNLKKADEAGDNDGEIDQLPENDEVQAAFRQFQLEHLNDTNAWLGFLGIMKSEDYSEPKEIIPEVSTEELYTILSQASSPIVVDTGALAWCAACRKVSKALNEIIHKVTITAKNNPCNPILLIQPPSITIKLPLITGNNVFEIAVEDIYGNVRSQSFNANGGRLVDESKQYIAEALPSGNNLPLLPVMIFEFSDVIKFSYSKDFSEKFHSDAELKQRMDMLKALVLQLNTTIPGCNISGVEIDPSKENSLFAGIIPDMNDPNKQVILISASKLAIYTGENELLSLMVAVAVAKNLYGNLISGKESEWNNLAIKARQNEVIPFLDWPIWGFKTLDRAYFVGRNTEKLFVNALSLILVMGKKFGETIDDPTTLINKIPLSEEQKKVLREIEKFVKEILK